MSELVNQSVAGIPPTPSPKKVCIYFEIFSDEEKLFYEQARQVEALDDKIVLLRVRIMSLSMHKPDDISMLLRALICLDRLCKTNRKVFLRDQENAEKIKQNTIALLKGLNIPPEFVEKKFH
jgi:hypothetical protein